MALSKRKPPTSSDEVGGEDVRKSNVLSDHYTNDTSPQSNIKLDHALNLVRHGFFVFPLVPFGTTPAIDDWQNVATIDEDKVRELWVGDNADCNIGIYTGKYRAPYAPGKFTRLMRCLVVAESTAENDAVVGKEHGDWAHPDLIITKPDGGHYFFIATFGICRSFDDHHSGANVHATGSFVVAAGSETVDGSYVVSKNQDNWRVMSWPLTWNKSRFIKDPDIIDWEEVDIGDDWILPELYGEVIYQKSKPAVGVLRAKYRMFEVEDLNPFQYQTFAQECRALLADPTTDDKNNDSVDSVEGPPSDALPIRLFSDITPEAPDELVAGLLLADTMSVMYGDSNVGKSFLALYLALCVARGEPFYDRKTKKGLVAYVAAEGGASMQRRLAAARQEYDDDIPLALVPSMIDMRTSDADTDKLIAAVHHAEQQTSRKTVLVVIDTLARALAGGDENSPAAMGAFIGQCDRIRAATGAHVLVIHHSGKDKARGARGHSSLRAATDVEIEVTADDKTELRRATVMKVRDGAVGESFPFQLEEVAVVAADGEFTTCLVEPIGRHDADAAGLPGQQRKALVALGATISDGDGWAKVADWRGRCETAGLSDGDASAKRKAFTRAKSALETAKLIEVRGSKVRRMAA